MACDNDPGAEAHDAVGICHICAMRPKLPMILKLVTGTKGRTNQPIKFCPGCCHWMCEYCWNKVMGRLTGFIKEHVWPSPGCCGPKENH